MERELLEQFQVLYENQDMLSRLTDQALFSNMGYSEIHCLEVVDGLGEPNASAVAVALRMTRGAVSKIIKKLAGKELIEIFQKPGNKKEKYYRLTRQGKAANRRHSKAHEAWQQRDSQFLAGIPPEDKAVVQSFLQRFNRYLEDLIQEKTN